MNPQPMIPQPLLTPPACLPCPSLQTPVEASEEARLALAQLVVALVRLGGKAIAAYAGEVVVLIQVALGDAFHEVNNQGCAAVEALTGGCTGPQLWVTRSVRYLVFTASSNLGMPRCCVCTL